MTQFKAFKVISSVPTQVDPNTLYFVRVGAGFDLYCSDTTGGIAFKINDPTPPNVTTKFAAAIGDNINNVYTITHGLGSIDVTVSVFYNDSPYEDVIANIQRLDSNNVRLEFSEVIPLNKIRVVIVG